MQDKNEGTILIDLVKNIKVIWEKVGKKLPDMEQVISFLKKLTMDSHLSDHFIFGWKNGEICFNKVDFLCAFHHWWRGKKIRPEDSGLYLVPFIVAHITRCIYNVLAIEIDDTIDSMIGVIQSVCECATPYHALEIKNEFCALL